MATSGTPQPTAAVDPNNLTPEEIANQLAAQAAPVNNPPAIQPLERDFTIQLETGEMYRGATKDDLIREIAKGKENASKEIKRLRDSLAAQTTSPPSVPAQLVAPQFSNEQYWQLAAQDPRAAQDYVLQFTPEAIKLRETVTRLEAMEQDIKNRTEVATFQNAVNDFDFENPQVVAKFDENWEKLRLPMTAQNLIMAHNHFIRTGVYQPKVAQVQLVASGIQPLPTLGNNPASGQPAQQIDPNTMSTTDLAALIKSLNGQ